MKESVIRDQLLSVASADDFASSSAGLVEAWTAAKLGVECIVPILRFMEEHPSLDFGSPGPLVHFLEDFHLVGYEERLIESICRQPTTLTVWMLNRVINGTEEPEKREQFISTMRQAAVNPNADIQTVARVKGFLRRLTSEY